MLGKTYHSCKRLFKIHWNGGSEDCNQVSESDSRELGFASDGNGTHFLADVPNGPSTVSLRTSDGGLLTIQFNADTEGEAASSVDIISHKYVKDYNNGSSGGYKPTQDVLLWSRGQIIGQGSKIHETPCDKVAVLL